MKEHLRHNVMTVKKYKNEPYCLCQKQSSTTSPVLSIPDVSSALRLLRVHVRSPQLSRRGDPDFTQSLRQGTVVVPTVPPNEVSWSVLLSPFNRNSARDIAFGTFVSSNACIT